MLLPNDVLGLIKEYSKPIWTRPDWKTCKRVESECISQVTTGIIGLFKSHHGRMFLTAVLHGNQQWNHSVFQNDTEDILTKTWYLLRFRRIFLIPL